MNIALREASPHSCRAMGALRCFFLTAGLVAATGPGRALAAPPELELTHAWSVDGPAHLQTSGLALRDGVFYTVSDRHSDTVFRLEFSDDQVARAVVAVTFTGPTPYPEIGYLDLEGIALAPDGGFYVASEWGLAIAHVPSGGGTAEWVTPNVRTAGATTGLFATRDAFVEGVAVLGDDWFLLAAERQPRGLVEVAGGRVPRRVGVQQMDASRYPIPAGRSFDFADLYVWQGRVFALARNQHLVVELRRDETGAWAEGDAWSYANTENAAPYRYVDMTFGQGEGLAIDEHSIYVILDNNEQSRAGRPDDKRSWLFAFRNPIH